MSKQCTKCLHISAYELLLISLYNEILSLLHTLYITQLFYDQRWKPWLVYSSNSAKAKLQS